MRRVTVAWVEQCDSWRGFPRYSSGISSAELAPDRQYLIQQAARNGADPDPYRKAVVEYLSLPEELTKRAWKDPLIRDCHRLGLFAPAEAERFPLKVRGTSSRPASIVSWATGYWEKWDRVHRFRKRDSAED